MSAMSGSDALADMFRMSHNVPSTPARSLTGEVRERTIWAYWAQGYDEMPDFFKLCVDTWQRHSPYWDVRILQKSTVHEYLSEAELPNRFMHMLSHQTASDAVRLALLARYGGIYMDVSILLCTDLDRLCWDAIATGSKKAAVFYHPHYGTESFGGEDLTESWFLATRPGNPFFLSWRDLFCELLHNRLDIDGLLDHPLYQGIDLSGIDKLNKQFVGLTFDFREYLAIHAMCHRLIETDPRARAQWRDEFLRIDAADTAFRIQLRAETNGRAAAELLVLDRDPQIDRLAEGLPLIKFRTPDAGPLMPLSRSQLLDKSHFLGRLLSQQSSWDRSGGSRSMRTAVAVMRGRRGACTMASALCVGLAGLQARSGAYRGGIPCTRGRDGCVLSATSRRKKSEAFYSQVRSANLWGLTSIARMSVIRVEAPLIGL